MWIIQYPETTGHLGERPFQKRRRHRARRHGSKAKNNGVCCVRLTAKGWTQSGAIVLPDGDRVRVYSKGYETQLEIADSTENPVQTNHFLGGFVGVNGPKNHLLRTAHQWSALHIFGLRSYSLLK